MVFKVEGMSCNLSVLASVYFGYSYQVTNEYLPKYNRVNMTWKAFSHSKLISLFILFILTMQDCMFGNSLLFAFSIVFPLVMCLRCLIFRSKPVYCLKSLESSCYVVLSNFKYRPTNQKYY